MIPTDGASGLGQECGVAVLTAAFTLAATVHAGQMRKGSATPYLAHLLGVAELVMNFGGNDTEAAGALLHDPVEDGGGEARLADIEKACGAAVAAIVAACSDSFTDASVAGKEPWLPRKRRYIDHLSTCDVPAGAVLVSVCDKLHNLSATQLDYETLGEQLWGRFKTGWAGQVWYYRALLTVYLASADPRVCDAATQLGSKLELLEAALRRYGHDLGDVEASLTGAD